jgi:hypothetical protein
MTSENAHQHYMQTYSSSSERKLEVVSDSISDKFERGADWFLRSAYAQAFLFLDKEMRG